jgi:hypothetical protein
MTTGVVLSAEGVVLSSENVLKVACSATAAVDKPASRRQHNAILRILVSSI